MAGLLCMAALALAAIAAPSAQAAGPEWEVTSITTSVPVFHRTETEVITYHVKNIGDAASGEDVTVTDSYPGTTLIEARMVFPCPLAEPGRLHVPGRDTASRWPPGKNSKSRSGSRSTRTRRIRSPTR